MEEDHCFQEVMWTISWERYTSILYVMYELGIVVHAYSVGTFMLPVARLLYTYVSYVIYTENNTWMCGDMKFISSVDQDISRVSKANDWDILFNTRNIFHISKFQASMYCFKRSVLRRQSKDTNRNMKWLVYYPYWQYTDHFIFRHLLFCLLYKKTSYIIPQK